MSSNHIVCRLCLSEVEEENISLFSDYQNMEYKEIAKSLANLNIKKDDKLPDKICDECASKLVLFFKFKQKCEISERTLRRLILKEKIPVPAPPIFSKNTIMENLLKKYTNSDKLAPTKLQQPTIQVKEELSEPVPIKQTKDEEENDLKVSVKSVDDDEPEMEAEYLLEEFQSSIQPEIFVKEEMMIDYDDNQMEDDDDIIVSPILQKTSEQIRTKLKLSTKSCICELCGKAYAHPSSLQQHYQQHTGVKNFSCDLCETRFTRKSHLAVHMRIHNNEKPYICEICSMTFRKSGNLNRHMVVHSDKREFSCNLCDKAFKRSSGLLIHMRSHTGDRPYKCQFCNKTYSCYSGFRKHKRKHENSFNIVQGHQIELQILTKGDETDSDHQEQEAYLSREVDEIVEDDALKNEN